MHVSCDIGCHLFSILPPFNIGTTTMGYGLGGPVPRRSTRRDGKRTIAVMGDGGFWHNGLTSGVGNAVFNKTDNVLVVVDNGYSAATGGQDILSSRAINRSKSTGTRSRAAVQGVGVKWVRVIDRTYDLTRMLAYAARGADHAGEGAQGHRRGVRVHAQSPAARTPARQNARSARRQARGARTLRRRCGYLHRRSFLHPPVRLSVAHHPSEPGSAAPGPGRARRQFLRRLRSVRRGCACGGAVSRRSIAREIVFNPTRWDRWLAAVRGAVIGWLQRHGGCAARAPA